MKRENEWPKAIFYDSKNTLFDWSTVWIEAASNIVRHYGSKIDGEEFKTTWHRFLIGENHRVAFGEYREFTHVLEESIFYTFKYHGIPGNREDVKFMTDLWDKVQPFPDVLPAFRKQQEITKVILFSNVETRYLDSMVNKLHGFKPDFIGTMEQSRTCKPSPNAYRWVLEKNQLEAKDVLYCARPQWDVQGGIAFGMKAAWLNRAQEKLEGVKPDYEVKDLHGVTSIIESHLRSS